jgi:hypothetical protein
LFAALDFRAENFQLHTGLDCRLRSADFEVCRIAGFQTCSAFERSADLRIGDTAGPETCATRSGLTPLTPRAQFL